MFLPQKGGELWLGRDEVRLANGILYDKNTTIYSLLWLFTNDKKQEHYIPFNRPSWIPLVHIKWGFKSQSPLEPVVIGILIGIFSSSTFLNNQVQGPFEHFHAFSGD